MLDYLDESVELESMWKCHATANRITTHNPRYLALQQSYILQMAAPLLLKLNSSKLHFGFDLLVVSSHATITFAFTQTHIDTVITVCASPAV